MYIGIDIGGTNIRVASFADGQKLELIKKQSFKNSDNYDKNMQLLIKAIHELSTARLNAIGISSPGKLNHAKTKIIRTTYLPQWIDKPIVDTLAREFACPIVMAHDSICAALGEIVSGGTSGNFLSINYGTGIGACTVTCEENMPVVKQISDQEHFLLCKPWQEACGGRGVEMTYGKPAAELTAAEWDAVFRQTPRFFAPFLQHFKPDTVIFSGGVAVKQWPRFQAVLEGMDDILSAIRLASLKEDTNLYGAVSICFRDHSVSRTKSKD